MITANDLDANNDINYKTSAKENERELINKKDIKAKLNATIEFEMRDSIFAAMLKGIFYLSICTIGMQWIINEKLEKRERRTESENELTDI